MSSVQSLDRALNILETIAAHESGIGISELSQITNLHKSTVHRLTSAWVENHYVEQTEDGRYRLSYKLYELGAKLFANLDVEEVSHPFLVKLADELNEVVHLVVRNNNEIIYVDKCNSDANSALMGSKIGSSAPLYCTSVGKAVLFQTSDSEVEKIWANMLIEPKTNNTILTLDDFLSDIAISRKRGYALDLEENEKGIICIGAPIYDAKHNICAALSISAPSSRLTERNCHRYALPLLKATRAISQALGDI